METKEYVVVLKEGVDYNQFWQEIESVTNGLDYIPDRPVEIINNQDYIPKVCHYALTDAEVSLLKNDSRVVMVEPPIEHTPELLPKSHAIESTPSVSFTIPAYNNHSGNNVNWGLIRHNYSTLEYGNSTTTVKNYNYVPTGANVDIVITDSGIEYYHPEFQTANGDIRIQQYNWTGTLDTSPNSVNFRDVSGHGTHVTGIAAGKTYGWAKDSAIFPMKINLSGIANGVPISNVANSIIAWHHSKGANGNATVVNASWGYGFANGSFTVTSINYRNSGNVAAVAPDPTKGMTTSGNVVDLASGNILSYSFGSPFRRADIDAGFDAMANAGIIVCVAAGNDGHKVDVVGGDDYNNYFTGNVTVAYGSSYGYYNQGMSPYSANAIIVGALDARTYSNSTTLSQKVAFSNGGPGVDIYATGWAVRSSISNIETEGYGDAEYYANVSFRQATLPGTSMASPEIAGICALYIQANPFANIQNPNNISTVKTWLLSNANTSAIYANTANVTASDYTNVNSQWGGNAGVAYQAIQGITQIKDSGNNWVNVANVSVKTDSSTWEPVKNIYVKTDSTTWQQVY